MYYLKNRYYDPEIRRFISADNFKSEKASMETLHNRNLFAYCDDNPLVRADQDGNAWMVAAASFVAGMGLSVGCQMIFEGKNLSEITGSLPLPQDLEPLWDFWELGVRQQVQL